jgi:hypothetical protein
VSIRQSSRHRAIFSLTRDVDRACWNSCVGSNGGPVLCAAVSKRRQRLGCVPFHFGALHQLCPGFVSGRIHHQVHEGVDGAGSGCDCIRDVRVRGKGLRAGWLVR